MTTVARPFTVALTGDFYDSVGRPRYRDLGLSLLKPHAHITHKVFAEHRPEIAAEQLAGAQGVIVLTPKVTAASVASADDLLVIARFGVGYDAVDVAACTAADVLVTITTGAVDRSVAEAVVGWMIALTHHVRVKDRLVRAGQWDQRSQYMGCELRDRTLGLVGLGGIARAVVRLLAPFGLRQVLAFDPFVPPSVAAELGVKLVELDDLMTRSDFVSVHCPLNDQTRGLLDARRLALLPPTSYLINTARGGIVDEDALFAALSTGRLAGAALDCFAQEPVTQPHRFGELDNVLLAPHSIAWTDELFRDIGEAACQTMVDLSAGRRPRGAVNPKVFDQPGFLAKWRRLVGPHAG